MPPMLIPTQRIAAYCCFPDVAIDCSLVISVTVLYLPLSPSSLFLFPDDMTTGVCVCVCVCWVWFQTELFEADNQVVAYLGSPTWPTCAQAFVWMLFCDNWSHVEAERQLTSIYVQRWPTVQERYAMLPVLMLLLLCCCCVVVVLLYFPLITSKH